MCHPGNPSPHGLSHFTIRPGSAAFQSVKSRGSRFRGSAVYSDRLQKLGLVDVAGELSVARKLRYFEVNIAFGFVGVALLDQLLDDLDHLRDVVGGLRELVRGPDSELLFVFEKAVGVELGNLGRRLSFLDGGGDDLVLAAFEHLLAHVSDIGDVLDVDDVHPLGGEYASDPVGHKV